jgi:hypothetical protein
MGRCVELLFVVNEREGQRVSIDLPILYLEPGPLARAQLLVIEFPN